MVFGKYFIARVVKTNSLAAFLRGIIDVDVEDVPETDPRPTKKRKKQTEENQRSLEAFFT